MPRLDDPLILHPDLRRKQPELDAALAHAGLPMRCYETGRSPFRQVQLFANKKTRAKAWTSYHQFGCAWDYVFWVGGGWSWAEPEKGMWATYRGIVQGLGLRPLSFEQPHAELPLNMGWLDISDVCASFLASGDRSWRAFVEEQAELWGHVARVIDGVTHPGAPAGLFDLERPEMAA